LRVDVSRTRDKRLARTREDEGDAHGRGTHFLQSAEATIRENLDIRPWESMREATGRVAINRALLRVSSA